MSEHESEFLKNHSLHFLEMASRVDKRGIVRHPDGYGKKEGICGDTVEIFLTVSGRRIQSVSFDIDGCIHTHACCNTLAHLAEGKAIVDAWKITPDDVVNYLETLPSDHFHCAELTMGAFYLALANYNALEKSPWKKWYQNR